MRVSMGRKDLSFTQGSAHGCIIVTELSTDVSNMVTVFQCLNHCISIYKIYILPLCLKAAKAVSRLENA